jgi:hypothetical protein
MESGRPYRKKSPDGFRAIHRELLFASKLGERIVIELLRNVPKAHKFDEERAEIAAHRLRFGAALLNGTDILGSRRALTSIDRDPKGLSQP